MSVIVDTSVWSLALRRSAPMDTFPAVKALQAAIADDRAILMGVIFSGTYPRYPATD